ncbi:MAG: hypothetical protein JXA06_00770 [Bacteroidetes bacterium]|nr:hypothetical protein [Bacteroidota bacterium]
MRRIIRSKKIIVLTSGIFFFFSIMQSFCYAQQEETNQGRIAILPIASNDISREELTNLTREFKSSLQNTGRFDIQPESEMDSLLAAAKFTNIEGCNYAICMADAGKALHVSRVMRIDITKHDSLFSARVRIVQTSDAEVSFDEVFKHTGDLDSYRRVSVPEQFKALTALDLKQDTSWFQPAIVVGIFIGVIIVIYTSIDSNSSSGGTGGGGSTTPQ